MQQPRGGGRGGDIGAVDKGVSSPSLDGFLPEGEACSVGGRPRSFDESEVLAKAAELFRVQGYGATSMAELSRVMGMGEQSIYNAFGNKASLLKAAFDHYKAQQIEVVMGPLLEPDASRQAIEAVFYNLCQAAPSDGHGCLITHCRELGDASGNDVRADADEHTQLIERSFAKAIARGVALGEFECSDVRALARYFAVAMHGFSVTKREGRSQASLRRVVKLILAPLYPTS